MSSFQVTARSGEAIDACGICIKKTDEAVQIPKGNYFMVIHSKNPFVFRVESIDISEEEFAHGPGTPCVCHRLKK